MKGVVTGLRGFWAYLLPDVLGQTAPEPGSPSRLGLWP